MPRQNIITDNFLLQQNFSCYVLHVILVPFIIGNIQHNGVSDEMTYQHYKPHGSKSTRKRGPAPFVRKRVQPAQGSATREIIDRVIKAAYGDDPAGTERLARALEVTVGMISHWRRGYRPIAAHHAQRMQQISKNKVKAREIAPKVFQ